jgi:hypothetical protein
MKHTAWLFLIFLLLCCAPAWANGNLDFTFHKMESGKKGPTLLVVGGIQGDEPGGFNAATLLYSHYTIRSGAVWVVPNLNFASIVKSSRGVYGDMNRKFSLLNLTDPEYSVIKRIKSIIQDKQVDLVLNLHDGSGFYRPHAVDEKRNPLRWGQSVIIDQESIESEPWGKLGELARQVSAEVNAQIFDPDQAYHVKNTNTRLGDREMEKTLSYFAIQHGKPAFGLEASKDFPAQVRVFCHVLLVESFMRRLGIEFERNFELTPEGVHQAINSDLALAFYDKRILLNLENIRDHIGYLPLKKGSTLEFSTSNPLVTVVPNAGGIFQVYYGNRAITTLTPQYFEYDQALKEVSLQVDGTKRSVKIGEIVGVNRSFTLTPKTGWRANVIGFQRLGLEDESGVDLAKKDIQDRFSLDRDGCVFRVEFYKGNKFAGMILVDFHVPDQPKTHLTSISRVVSLNDASPAKRPASPANSRRFGR